MRELNVLLSFDIEEFEMPREYGMPIPFEEQMNVSILGATRILDLLKKYAIKATFYTTANFADNAKQIMQRMVSEGHEIASHGYYHDRFEVYDLVKSREKLQDITGQKIYGFRMPRMAEVPEKDIKNAGYFYNSSINPIFLPGRYNKLSEPRTLFKREGCWQLPASVTPFLRFPLFWISFHNLPESVYFYFAKTAIKHDGYINLYFHPWEFTDLAPKKKYNFPFYITRNTSNKMVDRLENFIQKSLKQGFRFCKTYDFIMNKRI